MADIADVMDALQQIALQAVFPNGTSQPSILPTKPPQVAQGWPLAKDLDKMMAQGRSIVSIYAVPSSSSDAPQPFIGTAQLLTPAVHGLSVAISGSTLTISGTSLSAEYVTVFVAGRSYSATGAVGSTGTDIAASLASQIAADIPGTTVSGSTVQIATNRDVDAIVGAPTQIVDRIHRQRLQFRLVVWSPNPADRAALGRAIDVAVKRNLVFRLADTSQALMTYQGTNLDDKFENEGTYRRDLMVNVTYDTTDIYDGFEVTAVVPSLTQLPQPNPLVTFSHSETPMRALTVTHAFGEYAPGDIIVDKGAMKSALADNPGYVVAINLSKEDAAAFSDDAPKKATKGDDAKSAPDTAEPAPSPSTAS